MLGLCYNHKNSFQSEAWPKQIRAVPYRYRDRNVVLEQYRCELFRSNVNNLIMGYLERAGRRGKMIPRSDSMEMFRSDVISTEQRQAVQWHAIKRMFSSRRLILVYFYRWRMQTNDSMSEDARCPYDYGSDMEIDREDMMLGPCCADKTCCDFERI